MSKEAKTQEQERLAFLARITESEASHLALTTERLFGTIAKVREDLVVKWVADIDTAERLDAFVARFARLQDTVGDKLVPALLRYVGENTGPAADNLSKAEKFGWIYSAEEWAVIRRLRNQMIHDYIEDPEILADALEAGRAFTPQLIEMAGILANETRNRLSS